VVSLKFTTKVYKFKEIKNIRLERSDWISFFNFSTFGIPHEKKKAKGGEDASYASEK
jgi:hypothetical protein